MQLRNFEIIGGRMIVTDLGRCIKQNMDNDRIKADCEDFAENCLVWVGHKNHSRGYHNRK